MDQIRRSKLVGEVKGLVEEGFFFLLALRTASRVKSSCLLWFLMWGVIIGEEEVEGAGKDSSSGTVMRSSGNFTKWEQTHSGIAWGIDLGVVWGVVSMGRIWHWEIYWTSFDEYDLLLDESWMKS